MAHRIMVMSFMVDSTKSRWNFGKSFEYKTKLIEKEASWIQLDWWEISSLGADPPNIWSMYTNTITCQASLIYVWHYSNFSKNWCLFSSFLGNKWKNPLQREKKNQPKVQTGAPIAKPRKQKLMSLLQKSLLLRLLRTTPWSISQEKNTTLVQMKNFSPIL